MCPKHVEQAIRSAIKIHLLHLVGILFPHIIDDARSKPHQIGTVPTASTLPILLVVQFHDCSSDPAGEKDKMTRYPALVAGGRLLASGVEAANATLLATFCKDLVPRSCDHALLTNSTRSTRPCSLTESFFSSGDTLTLELRVVESTALRCVLRPIHT